MEAQNGCPVTNDTPPYPPLTKGGNTHERPWVVALPLFVKVVVLPLFVKVVVLPPFVKGG